ncbi:hypothetical protein PI172_0143 [Prevotella intermedia]|uniref:Uncharacterized protein n=1 Tax=Prevotella intermedia TaxID=28131 RepID=A0AAD1BHK3_PREIN|nr:hypothetical protein PIN17_A0621 [Prevotella intermedia 17]BAR94871.1 hypothetical protein PI172_0143 [Prevotella intermedia]
MQRKTAAFAMPKRSYHFLTELSLQNKGCFMLLSASRKKEINSIRQLLMNA